MDERQPNGKITIKEAARRIGISVRMLWKMVSEGRISAVKADNRACIPEAAVKQFADALEAATLLANPDARTYGDSSPDDSGRYFVRAVEAARMIGLTRQRVEQLVRDGDIAAFRIGRCVLLRPRDVEEFKRWRNGEKHIVPPPPVPAQEAAAASKGEESTP